MTNSKWGSFLNEDTYDLLSHLKLLVLSLYVAGSLTYLASTNLYTIWRGRSPALYAPMNNEETQTLTSSKADTSNYGTTSNASSSSSSGHLGKNPDSKLNPVFIENPQIYNSKLKLLTLVQVTTQFSLAFLAGSLSNEESIWTGLITCSAWLYQLLLVGLNDQFQFLKSTRAFCFVAAVLDGYDLRCYLVTSDQVDPFSLESILRLTTLVIDITALLTSLMMPSDLVKLNNLAEKSNRYPCPEPYSSWLSLATFSWVTPLLSYGRTECIEPNDIWSLRPDENALYLTTQFSSYPSTLGFAWKAFKQFKTELFYQMIFTLLSVSLTLASPVFLYKFLNEISEADINLEFLFYIVIAMFLSVVAKSICDSQSLFYGRRMGIRLKSIIIAEVYQKTLNRQGVPIHDDNDGTASNTGKIINFMSVDAHEISETSCYLNTLYSVPLQLGLTTYYLYVVLGWSAMVGLGLTFLILPLNYALALQWEKIQDRLMKSSDARMDIVNELLQGIRIVKFFAWEPQFLTKISKARSKELGVLMQRMCMWLISSVVWSCFPMLITIFTFYAYTSLAGNTLTSTVAFTSLVMFKALKDPVDMMPMVLNSFLQARVSLGRIDQFLSEPDTKKFELLSTPQNEDEPVLGFKGCTVQWPGHSETSSNTNPFQLKDMNITFPVGELSLVIGPTGSGKTSLIAALLGEMEVINGKVFLPRKRTLLNATNPDELNGGIAYVSQSAWLQQASIRDNILFNEPYHESRYQQVIKACALATDFNNLEDGDLTEIGEKGITLSGGQKQRVALARAVYSRASHIILDDCLSAVDSHTAKHLFRKCLMGPLMKGRTKILVTHNVSLTLNKAAHIVVLGPDGTILGNGTRSQVESIPTIQAELAQSDLQHHQEALNSEAHPAAPSTQLPPNLDAKPAKKLVLEEERAKGAVSSKIYHQYYEATGGKWFWIGFLAVFLVQQGVMIGSDLWVRYWANSGAKALVKEIIANNIVSLYAISSSVQQFLSVTFSLSDLINTTTQLVTLSSDKPNTVDYYLSIYALLSATSILIIGVRVIYQFWGSLKASRLIHDKLVHSILHAPIRFFDTTPIGRLVNRFSKDLQAIDQEMMSSTEILVAEVLGALAIFALIAYVMPPFVIIAGIISIVYYQVVSYYIAGSREIKRIESTTRSPIYAVCGETILGADTIRAYEFSPTFFAKALYTIDQNIQCFFYLWAANRWLSIRSDIIGGLVVFSTGTLILGLKWYLKDHLDPSFAGLAFTYALNFSTHILWIARFYAIIEMNMNSIERVQEYLDIPLEPASHVEHYAPSSDWPTEGHVVIKDLKVRYSPDREPVLHDISLTIQKGEKVGIVGRTGAGKSTLALMFFRFVEPDHGNIEIDGMDIFKMGVRDLREKLTIIPQDAVLFSGTVRSNLDPFNSYSDSELWAALRRVHLVDEEEENDKKGGTITSLDMSVAENGQNFSQGQRQLLSLSRALLKQTKVIIMDEATASVDYHTDSKIQHTIRQHLTHSTLLCIAHRLRTIIDYDKVLVLEHGRVKEFDTPRNLIEKEGSIFRDMCKESGELDVLIDLAKGKFNQPE